jgi:putative membrane protein
LLGLAVLLRGSFLATLAKTDHLMNPQNELTPAQSTEASNPAQPRNPHTSDHLANERTFLAWIRTSISVIGLGFVVAKFSVWLRELSARLNEPIQAHHTGLSLPMGVGMMAVGGLFAVMAAWRYRSVRRAIENGGDASDERTVMVVTLLILAIAAALVVYMLATR